MAFACSNGNNFKDIPLSPGNHWKTCFLGRQVWVPKRGCLKEFSRKNSEESLLYLHVNTSITEPPRCSVHQARDMRFHATTLEEYRGLHKCMQFFVFVVISLWFVDDE